MLGISSRAAVAATQYLSIVQQAGGHSVCRLCDHRCQRFRTFVFDLNALKEDLFYAGLWFHRDACPIYLEMKKVCGRLDLCSVAYQIMQRLSGVVYKTVCFSSRPMSEYRDVLEVLELADAGDQFRDNASSSRIYSPGLIAVLPIFSLRMVLISPIPGAYQSKFSTSIEVWPT